MPQAVGVEGAPDGGKVEELEAHDGDDAGDDEAGPDGPGALRLAVLAVAVPDPEGVLDHADGDVGGHVVGVVPGDALEVGDVGGVEEGAEQGPGAQDAAAAGRGAVEAEDAHDGVVEAVEDGGAGGEVVELLGGRRVARVEDGGEDPRGDADLGEHDVKGVQRVGGRDGGAELAEAVAVRHEVAEGEENRGRLLHAEEAVEGPFAVELNDGQRAVDTAVCDDVLAGVVAFGGTCPEEEAAVESCQGRGGQHAVPADDRQGGSSHVSLDVYL
ncbi:hypothetical protein VDGD_20963 [Verticillium dahliae]|nr:hypothetical protein VDGD_20963 [Verticillium dahliae]